ncbi:hypothetical protein ACYOEI_03090 [Singulisphaera rosea]
MSRSRDRQHAARLGPIALAAALSGCNPDPVPPVESAVLFDRPVLNLGFVGRHKSELKLDARFRVQGNRPVVIDSVSRSCQCTSIGEGIVHKRLLPGSSYELPVTIAIRNSPTLAVRIELNSEGKTLGSLLIQGVLDGDATPSPRTVHAQFQGIGDEAMSGEFQVSRLRMVSGLPLEPAEATIRAGRIEATLKGRDEHRGDKLNDSQPDTVTDRLTWRWTASRGENEAVTESLLIPWKNEEVAPTRVEFSLTKAIPFVGVPRKIWCGTLRPGELWSHSIVLRASGPRPIEVAGVRLTDKLVSADVKSAGGKMAIVKFSVTAPATVGDFQIDAVIVFKNQEGGPVTIPIVGTVAP